MSQRKVVAIGANVLDTLICAPVFPNEDTKLKADEIIKCGGGPAATGLVAASKLGADCTFLGNLADDDGGAFLKKDFEKYGVNADHCTVLNGYGSFLSFVVLSAESKSRTCLFHRGNLPGMVLSDAQKEIIKESDLLMVDGNDLEAAIAGAKLARENGVDVLYDAGGLYEGIEGLLPYANILIPSYEFATGFTKTDNAEDAAKKLYEAYHPELVVITDGKNGGYLYDGDKFVHYPAFPVEAVDSNGAGDVFHGAFAFARVSGRGPMEACIFSSAVSALKCTKVGARDGVPNYQETINFLKERGYDEFEKNME